MKKIEIVKELEKYPLFTINEFVRITKKAPKYTRTYLYRLKKEGLIFGIERSKYTVFNDPMIFASYILLPSYISFWTAFKFYDFTEQLPRDIMMASPKPKKAIEFHGTKIRFFKIKHMWGFKKERYMDFDIFIAEREKCIIDSLLIKNTPFDEIAKAIETSEFSAERFIEYAIKTNNRSLMKRLGYLMEKYGLDAGKLIKYLDNNYIVLDWSKSKKGKRNTKWKIIRNSD